MAPSRTRRRGTFGAFRRPFVTDPVFWIAALMALAFGAVVGVVVLAMLGVPSSWVGWLPAGVAFVVAGWLAFKLLAMGMNMNRALHEPEPADDGRASSLEGTGRAAGAIAGRGVAALTRRNRPAEEPTPPPAASAPPAAPTPEAPAAPAAPTTPLPAAASAGPEPEAASTPASEPPAAAPADEAAPEVTVDKAARVIGSMIGRRMGERRRDGS